MLHNNDKLKLKDPEFWKKNPVKKLVRNIGTQKSRQRFLYALIPNVGNLIKQSNQIICRRKMPEYTYLQSL